MIISVPKRPGRPWSPPSLLSNGYGGGGGSFPEIKQPGRKSNHSPSSSAEVKMRRAIPPVTHTSSWHGTCLSTGAVLILYAACWSFYWRHVDVLLFFISSASGSLEICAYISVLYICGINFKFHSVHYLLCPVLYACVSDLYEWSLFIPPCIYAPRCNCVVQVGSERTASRSWSFIRIGLPCTHLMWWWVKVGGPKAVWSES